MTQHRSLSNHGEVLAPPSHVPTPNSACMTRADLLGWHGNFAVEVGGFALGVRTNSAEMLAWLESTLAQVHRPDINEPPANFSLRRATQSQGLVIRSKHELFQNCQVIFASLSLRRCAEVLAAWLHSFELAARTDLLALNAVTAVKDGLATVVPRQLRPRLLTERSRLQANGIYLLDCPIALVDPARGMVVVDDAPAWVNAAALARGDALEDPRGRSIERPCPSGSYPLASLGTYAVAKSDVAPVSRASVVSALASVTENRATLGPQSTLELLVQLTRTVPLRPAVSATNRACAELPNLLTSGAA